MVQFQTNSSIELIEKLLVELIIVDKSHFTGTHKLWVYSTYSCLVSIGLLICETLTLAFRLKWEVSVFI